MSTQNSTHTSATPSVRLYSTVIVSFQWLDLIGCMLSAYFDSQGWDPVIIHYEKKKVFK